MTDYRTLVTALNRLDAERANSVSAASRAYDASLAGAFEEVAIAQEAVRVAEESARIAAQRVAEVDERATGLWREFAALLGRRGRRLGPLPVPDLEVPLAGRPDEIDDPLDRACDLITRTALGEPIALVPKWITGLAPLPGAIAAIAVAAPVHAILALTDHKIFAVSVIAEIALFLAPFGGVPPLMIWTRRHYGTRPDIGSVAMTTLGGMIASCALVALFH